MKRLLITVLLASRALGQTAPSPDPAILHTQARLVVVDVVVNGKDRMPVRGLQASDFTVLDEGKPQTLKSFEEHARLTPAQVRAVPAMPVLPRGTFTSFHNGPQQSALNILLLDAINSPLGGRIAFNQQMQHFLDAMQPGTMVAVFGLSTHLTMLQGFTSDPALLRAAITQKTQANSPLLDTISRDVVQPSLSDQMEQNGMASASMLDSIGQLEVEKSSFDARYNAVTTFNQLETLAHYLASLPGRKNVIWATGGFALSTGPDPTAGQLNQFRAVQSFDVQFKQAAQILSDAQVSVYPIDDGGLATSSVFAAGNETRLSGSGAPTNALTRKFITQSAAHDTMNQMARATGGQAFYNTNGFAESVTQAIDTGGHFYTLAYSPAESGKKDRFRKIEVKLAREGYQLSYRRGYFPGTDESATGTKAGVTAPAPEAPAVAAIRQAFAFGSPPVGDVVFNVRVLPAATPSEATAVQGDETTGPGFANSRPPFRRYLLDYAVFPQDLTFHQEASGSWTADIEFVALAYAADGRLLSRTRSPIHTTLTAAGHAALTHGGFSFHQEISVPLTGALSLRAGVYDPASGRIGSVEVPIAALTGLPPGLATAPLKPDAPNLTLRHP